MTGAARAQSADSERYTLRAEAGLEYDTNAHRTEVVAGADNPPLVASPLERLVLAATLSDVVAEGQLLTLGATAAAKIFDAPAARDEDVAIAQCNDVRRECERYGMPLVVWAYPRGAAVKAKGGIEYNAPPFLPTDVKHSVSDCEFRTSSGARHH